MEFHTLLLFNVACLSINLIPGPDIIYIVSKTMKGKMASGLEAALGLGVGYFIHTLAAYMGLSAIILSSALAFTIIKYLGAAYLLYLGLMSLKSIWQGQSKLSVRDDSVSQHNVFKQGVVVSVLNPKIALFFLSFLPQFIALSAGSADTQLFVLGVLFSALRSTHSATLILTNALFIGFLATMRLSDFQPVIFIDYA